MRQNLFVALIIAGTISTLISSCGRIGKLLKSPSAASEASTTPTEPRPDYLKPVIDPKFGTTVTRISDRAAFDSDLRVLRHNYSKNQPWNADESYLLLNFKYPAALLDARTYKFIRWVKQPSQSVWSNINPALMYGMAANTNQFVKLNIATGSDAYTVMHTFGEYQTIDFGAWEGNLSNDDRYAALVGTKAGKLDFVVYDLLQDRVTSRQTQPDGTVMGNTTGAIVNNISMTQSGKYVIVQYNKEGKGVHRGIHLLNRSLKFVRQLSARRGTHFDSCLDTNGSESIVLTDDVTRAIVSVDYATGKKTVLLPETKANYSIHVSCRNSNRPGWAYISEFSGDLDPEHPDAVKKTIDRTFALKLDGSGTTEEFAAPQHSLSKAYERQPQSVPNHDGTKVIFASDWGDASDPVYAYISEQKSPVK